MINEPGKLADMRRKARNNSVDLFDSRKTSRYWDRLYRLVSKGKEGWPDDVE